MTPKQFNSYKSAHRDRIITMAIQYSERKAKFSWFARLFKLSKDEKFAYKLYKFIEKS